MIKNKQAVGRQWAFAISFIFALTVIVFIFNMVFNYNLGPLFIDLMPNTDAGDAGVDGINAYLDYWKFIPVLILINVLIYMGILIVKKESTERYFP